MPPQSIVWEHIHEGTGADFCWIETSHSERLAWLTWVPISAYKSYRAEFNAHLCCLLVSGLVAWRTVGIPYWQLFFAKWVSGASLPTCKQFSGRILDEEAEKSQSGMRSETVGLYEMGQCDGWKNVTKSSLVTSMVNVEYNPFLLGVENVSSEQKTAENLMKIVLNKMKQICDIFKVILVAWCTDASSKSAKMCHDLLVKFPWLVVLDCWAHQINRVVGNIIKLKVPLIQTADKALDLIK
ncbi:hypothetical protein K435DRAFT_795344 [Dendrothele bispora CBS 962.96]|uniref:Uncharacterized protein n=1 Tax=Dendrothele bispora (strain CBS 962.96) TaxID=1314807 RepID=A0A4S8L359_DENBC|nr:hypothetical protein K435DRAFT_807886 [Dendrothele bispora CBS 962.96]THU98941.1 hypothetical protein K435DRAFT_795344 [Dendrothele bispora CBS 962.96]